MQGSATYTKRLQQRSEVSHCAGLCAEYDCWWWLKELVIISHVCCGDLLVGGCSGASYRIGRLPSKVSYLLWGITQEIVEIALSDVGRDQDIILFQGFNSLDS